MKSKLRLLITMLLMAVMGSVWADSETIILSEQGYSNAEVVSSTQGNVITLTYNKGTSTTDPAYYNTGNGVRVYAGGNMTITAGNNTITNVTVTYTKSSSPTIGWSSNGTSSSTSTSTPATWEGEATEVSFNVTTKGQARISQVEVTYIGDTPSTYTVTYNANGGEGNVPVDGNNYSSGDIVTVLGQGNLTKSHNTFANWNTSADGTETSYSAGNTFTITANTVLYAQWSVNTNNVTLPAADAYGTYTMNVSNPVAYGTTVALTYTPASGYENYAPTWSVNGQPITGNTFTMPDEDVTVTVSVEEVTTTSLIVDFENATSAYPEWTFTTITSQYSNSGVSAHGGSYYGSTDGKTTGSIQTKNTIESPQALTCYLSKQTNNTTESTWYIQVSSDGSTWTDVATHSAVDMSKGEWVKFSADLSSYSNVYVRVYYSGTTAIRLIDDLTLTVNSASVATPTISLASGTYNEPQTATITCDTDGAAIYYTTDGSDPTASSTPYTDPITIGESMTLKAIAVLDDESSSIASAEYVLKVATPEFSLASGTYRGEQTVTITSATPNATIYYTTDGSEPTTSSAVYSGAISVTETSTLKAIAVYGQMDNSDVATASYTIKEPLSGDVFVKATSEDELEDGMEIIIVNDTYFKVMGAQKENNFGAVPVEIDKEVTPYEAVLEDDNTTTLILEGGPGAWYFKTANSDYLYTNSTGSNCLHTQSSKDNNAKATISFNGNNSDAVITFQGIETRNIIRYNSGSSGNDLFSCYTSGQNPVQIYYRAPQQTIAKPTITPTTGTYTEAQTVTITNNAEGTTLYYTTDGTTPTGESTKYTNSFVLGKNGEYVVKAIAIGADGSSRVTTSTITINITVDAPVFTEADGTTFDEPYTIHLTAAEGTTIYYTTGSASPVDEDGNLTSAAIAYNASTGIANLNNAVTINAVAIDQWGNVSVVSAASYKYIGEVTLPYYENFDEGLGNFTTYPTNTGTSEVKWEFAQTSEEDISIYGEIRKYARIKGGTTSETSNNSYKRFVGNDYLVSPVIDMGNMTNVTLNFIHAGHYFGTGYDTNLDGTDNLAEKKASCKLLIRDVTNGVPTDVTSGWTDISDRISNWFYQEDSSHGGLFPRVNSGDISLNDFIGDNNKVQIAFYFTTDATMGGYWNVLKFAVTGTEAEVDNYEEVTMSTDGYITYVVQNDIDWKGMRAKDNTDDAIPVYGYKVIEYSLKQKAAVLVEFGYGNDGDDKSLPEYSEAVIPANTPLILKGCEGTNKLLIAKSQDVIPAVKGNLLKPSFGDVTVSADQAFYVLQKQSGWTETDPYNNYWFNRLKTGRTIPNRKAYLNGLDMVDELTHEIDEDPTSGGTHDPGMQGAPAFYIIRPVPSPVVSDDAGIVDGIETVEKSHLSDNEFYTICGVRVNHPTKGLYIVNGKKVIIK